MQLDGVMVFVKVIQSGSFTAAAKLMGMPVTTVSGKVAALEKSLGVTLIQRTTRKLHITQAGEVVYKRGLNALEEIQAAEHELASAQGGPSGLLRITAPVDMAQSFLLPYVQTYLKRYPQVKIELVLTNRRVDLVGENVDLGIRVGALKDSTLIARKILDSNMGIWVSSQYLKKNPSIKNVSDLKDHNVLRFTELGSVLKLTDGKKQIEFPVTGSFMADDMTTLKLMVLSGEGIGILPDFLCLAEEKSGKLIRLFPQWRWQDIKVSFVYPAQRFVSPKIQSFIQWVLKEG